MYIVAARTPPMFVSGKHTSRTLSHTHTQTHAHTYAPHEPPRFSTHQGEANGMWRHYQLRAHVNTSPACGIKNARERARDIVSPILRYDLRAPVRPREAKRNDYRMCAHVLVRVCVYCRTHELGYVHVVNTRARPCAFNVYTLHYTEHRQLNHYSFVHYTRALPALPGDACLTP